MDKGEQQNNSAPIINAEAESWHFWFLTSFSLLLVITFVYYLPLRFLYTTMSDNGHMMEDMPEDVSVGGGNAHGGHDAATYHEENEVREGLVVNLHVLPGTSTTIPTVGIPVMLDFWVNEKPGDRPILADRLEYGHEKLMHVIGVRDDMNEFFHIHPQPIMFEGELADTGVFSIDYVFANPGRYKVWSEIKKDDVTHTVGHKPFIVEGEGPTDEKRVTFARSVVVSGYQVVLAANEPIGKGVDHDLYFDIHDAQGNEVEVEPYLGADMHLALIKDDWSEFIHAHPVTSQTSNGTHPEDSGGREMMEDEHPHSMRIVPEARAHTGPTTEKEADDMINFRAVFPSAGLYRAYAQFRPAGSSLSPDESLVATFWIRVEEQVVQKASLQTQWWGLLFISLIAIGALSWGVNRYLVGK
ncbi:MAG: hypothetical protein G01um101429_621 [Parcubacteria group bacterium Gr01-1014_29]|nr:MAG: hypothetical protein G01um101429_621 [Parcubacteria group bacterium Gr01-1014_29]